MQIGPIKMNRMLDKPRLVQCRKCGKDFIACFENSTLCISCRSLLRWGEIQREIRKEREEVKNGKCK